MNDYNKFKMEIISKLDDEIREDYIGTFPYVGKG